MNADPDPALKMNADQWGIVFSLFKYRVFNASLIIGLLVAFLPSFFALFRPHGSGSAFGMQIRILVAIECWSIADPDPKHYYSYTVKSCDRALLSNVSFSHLQDSSDPYQFSLTINRIPLPARTEKIDCRLFITLFVTNGGSYGTSQTEGRHETVVILDKNEYRWRYS
jgi:hypothetical protein